jgi:hypothetical protein
VVGYADNNGKQFAFLWDPTLGLMDLNDLLIPSQPDWVLYTANGINGNMRIIGQGTYQGESHAFLLNRVGTSATEAVNFLLLLQNLTEGRTLTPAVARPGGGRLFFPKLARLAPCTSLAVSSRKSMCPRQLPSGPKGIII